MGKIKTVDERRRITLFLMEQIIIVGVFIISATLCVRVFVSASMISDENVERDYAVASVSNVAEVYKSCGGDFSEIASIYSDAEPDVTDTSLKLYYDGDWNLSSKDESNFVIRILYEDDSDQAGKEIISLNRAKISALYEENDKEIFSVTIAAQKG